MCSQLQIPFEVVHLFTHEKLNSGHGTKPMTRDLGYAASVFVTRFRRSRIALE